MQGPAIQADIVKYLRENHWFSEEAFNPDPDQTYFEQQILDSTGLLDLLLWLETTYDIRIADDEVTTANLGGIAKTAEFVVRKLEDKCAKTS